MMNQIEAKHNPANKEFFTPIELAGLLKVSQAYIYKMVKKGTIPYYKIGKSVRFGKLDVQGWIDRSRVEKKAGGNGNGVS